MTRFPVAMDLSAVDLSGQTSSSSVIWKRRPLLLCTLMYHGCTSTSMSEVSKLLGKNIFKIWQFLVPSSVNSNFRFESLMFNGFPLLLKSVRSFFRSGSLVVLFLLCLSFSWAISFLISGVSFPFSDHNLFIGTACWLKYKNSWMNIKPLQYFLLIFIPSLCKELVKALDFFSFLPFYWVLVLLLQYLILQSSLLNFLSGFNFFRLEHCSSVKAFKLGQIMDYKEPVTFVIGARISGERPKNIAFVYHLKCCYTSQ